jgi:putative membrane protein
MQLPLIIIHAVRDRERSHIAVSTKESDMLTLNERIEKFAHTMTDRKRGTGSTIDDNRREKEEDDDNNNNNKKSTTIDRSTQFLANERTFLAWLRTCIAIIGLGFVVARFSLFLREFELIMAREGGVQVQQGITMHSPSSILGLSMVGLGVMLTAYAFYNYRKAHHIIQNGGTYTSRHSIMYLATIGLIVFGIIVIAYLLLISI